jgi:hypothetical protein
LFPQNYKGVTAFCVIVSNAAGVGPLTDLLVRDAMRRAHVEMDGERLFSGLYAFDVIDDRRVNRADPTRCVATKAPWLPDARHVLRVDFPRNISARG